MADNTTPYDLSDYALLDHGDDHFTVQHPDGTNLTIAKLGLPQKFQDAIANLPPAVTSNDAPAESGASGSPATISDSSPAVPQNSDAGIAAPSPARDTQSMGDIANPNALPTINKAFNMEATGIQGQANAESAQSKALTDIYGKQAAQLSQIDKDTAEQTAKNLADREQFKSQVINGKIDPQRWWANQSTGNKVLAAISLALGGLSSAFTGRGNPALEIINKTIDQDIDGQKSNLDKNKWLLEDNIREGSSLLQNALEKKTNALAMVEAQVHQMAARYQDPAAQARAMQLIGGLKAQQAQLQAQMGQQYALTRLHQMMAQGATNINPETLDEKTRERAVQLPNGKLALAPTKEAAADARKTLTSLDAVDSHIKDMEAFQSDTGRTLGAHVAGLGDVGSDAYHQGRNLQKSLILELGKLHDVNRLTEPELKMYTEMVADPGAWNGGRAKALMGSLKELIKNKRQAVYQDSLEGIGGYTPQSVKKGYAK